MSRCEHRKPSWAFKNRSLMVLPTAVAAFKRYSIVCSAIQSRSATALINGCCGSLVLAMMFGVATLTQANEPTQPSKTQPVVIGALRPVGVSSSQIAPKEKEDVLEAKIAANQTRNSSPLNTAGDADRKPPELASKEVPRLWLDIRPRSIDKANSQLIPVKSLPEDLSKLPTAAVVTQLSPSYTAELLPSHFCGSAQFRHRPLYFEDRNLERYGVINSNCSRLPAVHSGLLFFGQTAALPLSMVHIPPHSFVRSGCIVP